jgi:hypothetical protein
MVNGYRRLGVIGPRGDIQEHSIPQPQAVSLLFDESPLDDVMAGFADAGRYREPSFFQ